MNFRALQVQNNGKLARLELAESVAHVNGSVVVTGNGALEAVAFPALARIDGALQLSLGLGVLGAVSDTRSTNTCRTGLPEVTSAVACQTAATQLGRTYGGSQSSSSYPKGCFSSGGTVYSNVVSSGRASSSYGKICFAPRGSKGSSVAAFAALEFLGGSITLDDTLAVEENLFPALHTIDSSLVIAGR